jgi:hypothetical protein
MPPLVFNGVTIPDNSANALTFNGSDVTQVVFNGTTVWQQSLGASYDLGITPILDTVSGSNNAWSQRTVDVSGYAGATVRPVFRYLNGSSFRGDIQLDQIVIGGTTSSFESSADSYQRNPNSSQPSNYASVNWESVSTSGSNGEWKRDSGGTPSGNTGRTDAAAGSFYLFAETSGSSLSNNAYFWLRGPAVTLDSSNPVFTYYEARYGSNIGTLDVYLDVIS